MQLRTLRQKAGLLTAYNNRARSPPAPPPPVPPAPMWALRRGGGEENGRFLLCRVTKSFTSDSGLSSLLPAPMQQEQASLLPSGRVKRTNPRPDDDDRACHTPLPFVLRRRRLFSHLYLHCQVCSRTPPQDSTAPSTR